MDYIVMKINRYKGIRCTFYGDSAFDKIFNCFYTSILPNEGGKGDTGKGCNYDNHNI